MLPLTLFMNFYISITCTQILPLVIRTTQSYAGGWIFGFLFPVLCNFLMLQQILSRCVLLRAVYELDADVAGAVCEDTKEERTAVKKMRLSVHQQLKEEGIPEADWKDCFQDYFNNFAYKNRNKELGSPPFFLLSRFVTAHRGLVSLLTVSLICPLLSLFS